MDELKPEIFVPGEDKVKLDVIPEEVLGITLLGNDLSPYIALDEVWCPIEVKERVRKVLDSRKISHSHLDTLAFFSLLVDPMSSAMEILGIRISATLDYYQLWKMKKSFNSDELGSSRINIASNNGRFQFQSEDPKIIGRMLNAVKFSPEETFANGLMYVFDMWYSKGISKMSPDEASKAPSFTKAVHKLKISEASCRQMVSHIIRDYCFENRILPLSQRFAIDGKIGVLVRDLLIASGYYDASEGLDRIRKRVINDLDTKRWVYPLTLFLE